MSPADPTGNPSPPPPSRLNGWKEIAGYFGKGVRTVQRWEKDLGLPVHRIGGAGSEIVYALAAELDAWQASAAATKAMRDEAAAIPTIHDPAAIPQPAGSTQPAPPAAPAHIPASRRWVPLVVIGILVPVIIAAIFSAWKWRADRVSAHSKQQPADWEVFGNTLIVYGADKRVLWRHEFDFPLRADFYEDHPKSGRPVVQIADINNDGDREVLFVANPAGQVNNRLYCFSSDGTRELFSYKKTATVHFGDTAYAGPWRAAWVFATGRPNGGRDVWLVSYHHRSSPTVLERLDTSGRPDAEYWSEGQIEVLVPAVLQGRRVVLLGSTNEEQQGGALAVLDEQLPSGSAPARNPAFRCGDCPHGDPVAFLVFPRLDVVRALEEKAKVTTIVVDETGSVAVSVLQYDVVVLPEQDRDYAFSYYELDSALRVKRAWLNERWPYLHGLFEAAGLVRHPFGPEDEKQVWPVLRWNGTAFDEVRGPETPK
jgi:hypothetical protein